MEHHNIFNSFPSRHEMSQIGFDINFLGVKTRKDFVKMSGYEYPEEIIPAREILPSLPSFDEEYFEWVDLLESVMNAKNKFIMIELGAGYGRWLVNAAVALKSKNPMPFKLIGVEAEPTHFKMLQNHFLDNGICLDDHLLLNNAVTTDAKKVKFWVGEAQSWYGQAIDHSDSKDPGWIKGVLNQSKISLRKIDFRKMYRNDKKSIIWVDGITLNSILEQNQTVDLIDIDIQGEELRVIEQSISFLNQKVKRIHIGTHAQDIEIGLRKIFHEHGWRNKYDFGCLKKNTTPFGEISFNDGVQSWINPRLS
jgi:FkbM family methyltransferase